MKLRRFTPAGVAAFGDFLAKARVRRDLDPPADLLEHRTLTEVVAPELAVALQHFETKGDAAAYLTPILKPLPPEEVAKDAGLWTWLTLLYFDSVCPMRDGVRTARNDYQYIYEPNNSRHFYRHLLFVSWHIARLARDHNRLFRKTKMAVLDKVTEETMKRLYLTRIPCIFEVLDRLYWDSAKGRSKVGAIGPRPVAGDLSHRLPLRIRQLEMTYDLMSLTADQLIDLLGEEFAFARPAAAPLFGRDD